ncbi:MAG: tetratricopeptide repeat protein [Planctomycetes bacterium]|nr:tetratricopeptide repeat protein [Planctomycetota bacterium]
MTDSRDQGVPAPDTSDAAHAATGIEGAIAAARSGRTDEAWSILCNLKLQASEAGRPPLELLEGILHQQAGDWSSAERVLRTALQSRPGWAAAERVLGCCLVNQGRYDEAIALLRHGLADRAFDMEASIALAVALFRTDRVDDAVEAFRGCIADERNRARVEEILSSLMVTTMLADRHEPEAVMAIHRKLGGLFERPSASRAAHANEPAPERRLKIAYLSPNLRRHVLSMAIEPLLRHHDRERFHISVYAHVPNPDDKTQELESLADRWLFVEDLRDDTLAGRISSDGIDILIHPMGHWRDNRIGVLARKPAPVQVTYLINAPTSGLRAIDYLVADRWVNADGFMNKHCVESIVELASGYSVFHYDVERPAAAAAPSENLGFVTFGSFNNPAKLNDRTLRTWALIVRRTPQSRLLLKGRQFDAPEGIGAFRSRYAAAGGDLDRLELAAWCSRDEHFAYHDRLDIALDPFPFVGGMTTLDALWMGVPVVTLVGRAPYGRASYSFLHRIGAPELCAGTLDQYVSIAVELAGSPDRLRRYRTELRQRFSQSSLLDQAGHVRELEQVLHAMWQRWCVTSRRAAGNEGPPP